MTETEHLSTFETHRGLLFGIAWRMIGNAADAEDILQEALIRWQHQDASEIRTPRAFLVTMVTRMCLNHLDLAHTKHERAATPVTFLDNLPSGSVSPASDADLADALDVAFSIVLKCLSPVERAVFLLRDVFDRDYAEVAKIVEKSEENCRQILRRARERVAGQEHRYKVTLREQELALQEFLSAATSGDVQKLTHLLTEEISLIRDGENVGAPAPEPLRGREAVAAFLFANARDLQNGRASVRFGVRSVPFLFAYDADKLTTAFAMLFEGTRLRSIYQIRCPVRLRSLAAQLNEPGHEQF